MELRGIKFIRGKRSFDGIEKIGFLKLLMQFEKKNGNLEKIDAINIRNWKFFCYYGYSSRHTFQNVEMDRKHLTVLK